MMVNTVTDEKPTANPGLELMRLCACRSCGDLAPGAIREIDRLRTALAASIKLQSHDGLGNDEATGWRSLTCEGERCALCAEPASAKVSEEIARDDPQPARHPLTAYVCAQHFVALFGLAGRRLMTRPADPAPDQTGAPP